ncbi:MAG: DUF4369 domain-containing protein [Chitinophagaceae bacterium]|nr:MAG: DUF4369 domain-containing protein [Chitinophagaceae bacterium]
MSRIFLLSFLLCASVLACKTDRRTAFKISGKVKNLNGTKVHLEQFGIVFDNAVIENDSFSLSGNLTSMEMCEIVFKGDGYLHKSGKIMPWGRDLSVFVESGANYKLIANSEEELLTNNYKVESSSGHQNIYSSYISQEQKLRRTIQAKLNEIDVKVSASLGNDHLYDIYLDSLRMYEDRLKHSRYTTYRKLMSEDPNTYAAIYIASTAYDIPYDLPFYEGIYKRLNNEFREHDYGIAFKQKLDEAKSLKK